MGSERGPPAWRRSQPRRGLSGHRARARLRRYPLCSRLPRGSRLPPEDRAPAQPGPGRLCACSGRRDVAVAGSLAEGAAPPAPARLTGGRQGDVCERERPGGPQPSPPRPGRCRYVAAPAPRLPLGCGLAPPRWRGGPSCCAALPSCSAAPSSSPSKSPAGNGGGAASGERAGAGWTQGTRGPAEGSGRSPLFLEAVRRPGAERPAGVPPRGLRLCRGERPGLAGPGCDPLC